MHEGIQMMYILISIAGIAFVFWLFDRITKEEQYKGRKAKCTYELWESAFFRLSAKKDLPVFVKQKNFENYLEEEIIEETFPEKSKNE